MIKILYFGVLREQLQCAEESIHWSGEDSEALIKLLRSRGQDWAEALAADKIFRIVVNHQIVQGVVLIEDGAEVALLPPVTGG